MELVTEGVMARTMKATEFKARCLELMDDVAATGEPVVVTKRGKPVAQLAPITARPETLFGLMKGRIRIRGDVVGPVEVDWDAEVS